MDYGKGVILAFVFFILFIGTLAWLSFQEDVSLVSETYYKDELRHSEKMESSSNAFNLESPPVLSIEQGLVQIQYAQTALIDSGELKVMRPSDEHLDVLFKIKASVDSIQQFKLPVWKKGLYRVSMKWYMDGKSYYHEERLSIP